MHGYERAKIWILDDTARLPGWWKMTCLMDDDKVDGRWPKNEREQRWVEDDQKSKENKRMFSLFSFWWKTWPIENDLGSGTWHENGKQPEIKTKNLKLVFKNLKQWQPQGRLVPVILSLGPSKTWEMDVVNHCVEKQVQSNALFRTEKKGTFTVRPQSSADLLFLGKIIFLGGT